MADNYKSKKVISIGVVKELTGLSERQIRYNEQRKLIFPERTANGTRKYSFSDVETLVEIAEKREEGVQSFEIRKEMLKDKQKKEGESQMRRKMIRGQLNAHFRAND
ncbi:MerR family transcriptional regulator [Halobacillus shinanisalinarum]|uniref:MerR family transcriptional regulator n=1 Tax=Halobacillus shinanisalinarum TaxID=2932258 RepID=A0ABY4H4K6_9BACI|nr:MerR family transcriptional regulator [Halobacillus shinanisalinarum]UOQ93907.1 MerR family transcriptional regulator [Halobacillus shinanisalinarum]